MSRQVRVSIVIFTLMLAACERDAGPPSSIEASPPAAVVAPRITDPKLLRTGQTLFRDNCARCHGETAEGAREWRKADDNGRFPPPPLNGTGHAWHHPSEVLMEVIMDGSLGDGNMPAWRGKLTDDEVVAVIAWFQSLWSDDVYAVWSDLDLRYRQETQ